MDEIEVLGAARAELGEGPLWIPETRRLAFVDIDAGELHRLDPVDGRRDAVTVGVPLGFAVPVAGSDEVVCAHGADLVRVDETGTIRGRLVVEADRPGNRINDGKADPMGRLWFGSMSPTREPGTSALYRLDRSGLVTIDDTVGLSNGLDWDVSRRRMYYIDSVTQRIDVFDYDVATGDVTNRRPFAVIDAADGLPDGLTLDAEGNVWVALFRGGVIRCYDPDGTHVRSVELPVPWSTCPAFGGEGYETLFVTTSRHRLSAEERLEQPLAGAVLAVRPGATGRPAFLVAPEVAAMIGRDVRSDERSDP